MSSPTVEYNGSRPSSPSHGQVAPSPSQRTPSPLNLSSTWLDGHREATLCRERNPEQDRLWSL
eukprot:14083156-Alexandrium_andersonii.AAC.1